MAINIKAIMKYIDSIGKESALDKIHNYDVSGMSAEDLFGEAAIKELELEIEQESKSRSEVFLNRGGGIMNKVLKTLTSESYALLIEKEVIESGVGYNCSSHNLLFPVYVGSKEGVAREAETFIKKGIEFVIVKVCKSKEKISVEVED